MTDEADWEDYFQFENKKANEIATRIFDADKEIDQMVYQLYNITPEEQLIMAKVTDPVIPIVVAYALSKIMGTNMVSEQDYKAIEQEKQMLLAKTKDVDKIKLQLLRTQCKLLRFMRYHKTWKPVTRQIKKRTEKLHDEKVYIDFTQYPKDISENLREAYNCYVNNLKMSCYIMILRTIEISVSHVYDKYNKPRLDKQGRKITVTAMEKLNFVESKKLIGGAEFNVAKGFIHARNNSVHDLYIPTEKQIMSAFETVIILADAMKLKTKTNAKKNLATKSV